MMNNCDIITTMLTLYSATSSYWIIRSTILQSSNNIEEISPANKYQCLVKCRETWRDLFTREMSSSRRRDTRALTPIIRPFVFIQLSTRRVPAAEAWQGIVIPQGFIGNLGASSSPARDGDRGEAGKGGSKIENEHKKHKKRGAGQIAVEHSSAKGQFIFVCYINFLLRLLASTVSSLSSPASLCSQPTNLRSIRVSSLKTVNSARHQGECELAPTRLIRADKNDDEKDGLG